MRDIDIMNMIDRILDDNYFNQATRLNYDTEMQNTMVAMNKSLTQACASLIVGFGKDKDMLTDYITNKINELNEQEAQKVAIA